jgi:site-specific recombinase XerD
VRDSAGEGPKSSPREPGAPSAGLSLFPIYSVAARPRDDRAAVALPAAGDAPEARASMGDNDARPSASPPADGMGDKAHYRPPLTLVPTTPAAPAFVQADPELKADLQGAYALNTMRAYRADWRDWAAWCSRSGNRALPAEPRAVRDYLVDLAAGKKISTLRRRMAAIARVHKQAGQPFKADDPVIENALRRLAREKGTAPKGRDPLMTDELGRMVKRMPEGLRGIRDRAILLLGFAAAVRRSELVDLNVNDIAWRRDGVSLAIRRSKGDQTGEGQFVDVLYGRRESTCPVRALKRWLEAAKITAGPVFRPVERDLAGEDRLSAKMVAYVVKRAAIRAGIDPTLLAGHSLRSGHVTQALANGADAAKAKEQLRHKRIDTTLGYNKRRTFDGNTSGKLGL